MDDWDDEYENTNFESVQEDDIVLNSLDDFKEDDLFVEKMGFSKSLEHAIMCNDGRVALKLVEELIRDKAERKLKGLVKMSNSEIRRRSRIVITNKFVRLSANSVEEKPFVFVISILEAFVEKE